MWIVRRRIAPTGLKTLFKEVQRRSYPKHSFVINAGDNSDCFYIILSGKMKIVIPDEEGKEVILSILGAGDHFGEFSLIVTHRVIHTRGCSARSVHCRLAPNTPGY